MTKLVVLKVGNGSFDQGFPVTLQISDEGKLPHVERQGSLPANSELPQLYEQWQSVYSQSGGMRIRVPPQVTNVSYVEACEANAHRLELALKAWFKQPAIRDLKEHIQEEIHRDERAQIVLQSEDELLRKLPWHFWSLIAKRPNLELVLGSDYAPPCPPLKNSVRILAVLGSANGLDLQQDWEMLNEFPQAKFTLLRQPQRQALNEALWNDSWDILFFAGHGHSGTNGGELAINETESLSLNQLRYALQAAVKHGLKLAIFNSCSGLGLVPTLAEAQLSQMIVMREPVPDPVAHKFLRYFLAEFSAGESLDLAVRKAREQLQGLENHFPCASWLPIACQNPAVIPLVWPQTTQKKKPTKIVAAIASCLILSLAIIGGGRLWQGQQPLPEPEAELQSSTYRTFAEIAAEQTTPSGNWFYGGSTTWAAIRNIVDTQINETIPELQLNYIQDPVNPPSSGNGIDMLIRGRISFAHSSRPIRDEEYESATRRGIQLRQIPVAYDAIAVVVHPDLPIDQLTIDQLIDIYTGDLTNWQALGGPDLPILPYTAPFNSGAPTIFRSDFFAEGQDFDERVQPTNTPSEAMQRVGNPANDSDTGGIYMASARNLIGQCSVKPLAIAASSNNFVAPYTGELISPENCPEQRNELNEAAIQSGQYPLVRRLFLITKDGESTDARVGETYADLLLSDEGQSLIREAGFIPLRSF
ncbi:substrate-binding domain-containing protein [Vacuolonema iberomarrocanum]|uniref:substrate-binding domain-containing protein n=1 Tax=Vacuolonema iberomarrocanum TaxID=3454632 RepID=UPI001A05088A|nr:substrate-binding domain-containing protein [filamentous cyanobacterium LEGE 07170]